MTQVKIKRKSRHDIPFLMRAGYRIYAYKGEMTNKMLNYYYHVHSLEVGYDDKEHLLFVKDANQ